MESPSEQHSLTSCSKLHHESGNVPPSLSNRGLWTTNTSGQTSKVKVEAAVEEKAVGKTLKEGFSCSCISFLTDEDRIIISQWLGAHMQIIFLKFIAVYSSYRHLFHKKSTTIFIKLEVRWAGKKGEAHSGMISQTNTHIGIPDQ